MGRIPRRGRNPELSLPHPLPRPEQSRRHAHAPGARASCFRGSSPVRAPAAPAPQAARLGLTQIVVLMLKAGFDHRLSYTDEFGSTHTPRSLARLWKHDKLEKLLADLEYLDEEDTARLLCERNSDSTSVLSSTD
jgi:hypothetical protein